MIKNNTFLRIISSIVMFLCLFLMIYYPKTVMLFGTIIFLGMLKEWIDIFNKNNITQNKNNTLLKFLGIIWLIFLVISFEFIYEYEIFALLWLLIIIISTDISGWFFGKLLKTDKLWENISPNKTWGGQIFGIIISIIIGGISGYYIIGYNFITSSILSIGFSLLSQYGDLTMSWIKRKFNIKDFSNLIPGHGGILDRFDGWIYTLPLMALFIKSIIG